MDIPEKGYKRVLVIAAYVIIAAAIVYVIKKYLLFCVLPVAIGWVIAYAIQKPVERMSKFLKIPKKLSAAFFTILLFAILSLIIILIFNRLFEELQSLYYYMEENFESFSNAIKEKVDGIGNNLKFIKFLGIKSPLSDYAVEMFSKSINSFLSRIPAIAALLISFVPELVFFAVILLISTMYLAADFHEINRMTLSFFPKSTRLAVSEFKNHFITTMVKMFRAYILIFIISFAELYFGLTLLRVEFAFSAAVFIAIVDALPILGSGAVIIPWAIVCFISNNTPLGTGLLILYAVITVIREFIEPKIVGDSIGLHPMISLISLFVGLKFLGVLGMILFPIIIICLINMKKNNKST